jgi:hypothetical protein
MKHKLLLSGILSVMLVFGLLLFTGCSLLGDDDPENNTGQNGNNNGQNGDNTGQNGNNNGQNGNNNGQNGDNTGQNGDNTGQNGDNTGQNGNNNGQNGNGSNTDTRQEGVYIGLISFAGNTTDLTSGVPILLNSAGKSSLISKLNSGYSISSQSGTALFYAVHKALANLKSGDTQYPAKLDSVNVITFTDGLDNGSTGISAVSPIEGQTFDSDNDYTTYLSGEIAKRSIAGKPITAYSVGVRGGDVSDTTKFESDLSKIASTGKSQSLTDFGSLQSTFQGIANGLQIAHSSTTFTMKTTLLASDTKVRMTFDVTGTNPTDAATSAKYIEGIITRTGTGAGMAYTFGSITYAGGLGSTQGAGPITGTINGTEVNFSFTGVSGYTPSTDESKAKQWTMPSSSTAWQVNSEYDISGATDIQVEKRSAIIYLVLDASKSLNSTQIGQIRTAVIEFINSLYDQLNNGSTPSTPSGDDNKDTDDYDPDDSTGSIPSNATTLTLGTAESGTVALQSPKWYLITLSSGNYELFGTSSYDVTVDIYKSSGSRLDPLNRIVLLGSEVLPVTLQSGTYYIRVSSDHTSSYVIGIERNDWP